jgi:hypothetical protein
MMKIAEKTETEIDGVVSNFRSQKKITSFILKKNATINVTRENVVKCVLQLVTVDGRPFTATEDSGLLLFLGPAMKILDLHFDRNNIADLVKNAASFVRKQLIVLLQSTLVSIKVDCVTRMTRSFIGLNVQVSSIKTI